MSENLRPFDEIHACLQEKFPHVKLSPWALRYHARTRFIEPSVIKGTKFYFDAEAQAKLEAIYRMRAEDRYLLEMDNLQLEHDIKKLKDEIDKLNAELQTYQKLQSV